MKLTWAIAAGIVLILTSAGHADERPGVPRRDFRGRTYYYEPITYYSPIWYAGNGVIATRRTNAPLWPAGQYNKIY